MRMLPSRFELRNLTLLALGAAVLTSIVLATPARAEDDDDDGIDSRILRSVLKGVGLRDDSPNIEYRERSPLVIPQNKKLPPPESASNIKDPNWPVEPEVKRERELKAAAAKSMYGRNRNTGDVILDEARPLTPDELAAGRTNKRERGSASPDWDGKPLKPKELGSSGGGILGSLFDSKKDNEAAAFAGEPPRASLTEPPSGYRTPSPNQPYAIGKERAGGAKATNYYETHGTMEQ